MTETEFVNKFNSILNGGWKLAKTYMSSGRPYWKIIDNSGLVSVYNAYRLYDMFGFDISQQSDVSEICHNKDRKMILFEFVRMVLSYDRSDLLAFAYTTEFCHQNRHLASFVGCKSVEEFELRLAMIGE